MPEAFVPMRAWLERALEPNATVEEVVVEPEDEIACEVDCVVPVASDVDDAIAQAKRFRAALEDAVACSLDDLLRDIASDVLARELALAPCDLRAIVTQALDRYRVEPLHVHVHPDEVPLLEAAGIPIVSDDSLRRGDVVLQTRYGSIDASLGIRLERLLCGIRT